MANYEEARVKQNKQQFQLSTKQIKICSKKQDWNNIENNSEKLSSWRIALWIISNIKTKNQNKKSLTIYQQI